MAAARRVSTRAEVLRLLLDGRSRPVPWLAERVNRVRPVGRPHVRNVVAELCRDGLVAQERESSMWGITPSGYEFHAHRVSRAGHEVRVSSAVDSDGERVVTVRSYRHAEAGTFVGRPGMYAIAKDYFVSRRPIRMSEVAGRDAQGREFEEASYVR
jgi:hypothetical protein